MIPRPSLAAPALWQFPSPRQWQLTNGLRVWAFDLPGQHVITVELSLDIPLGVEPRDQEGLATMALRVSDEGTVAHPDGQVAELLEDCGAAYQGGAGPSATHCSLDVPATRLASALPLFAEIVRTPAIAEQDVARHVALRLAEIEQSKVSPGSVAALAMRAALHDPDSREARPAGGTAQTVAGLDADQVRAFHQRWWRPEGAVLVLAGELPTDIDRQVEAVFGDWTGAILAPEHRAPQWSGPSAGAGNEGLPVYLVDRPGAVQSELRIAGPSVDRHSPWFAPLQVACTALGGAFGSRLNMRLREDLGYTYGVSMATSPARVEGSWQVAGSFRTEVAADALVEALGLLGLGTGTTRDPLTAAEVDDAIAFQVGIAPLRYATAEGVAGQAIALAAAGWEPDHVNTHFARVAAVTPELADQAFDAVVRHDQTRIVLVGDAAELEGPLTGAGHRVVALEV